MSYTPVVVSLPIADRPTSYRFYQDGLGLDAIGEPAEDGIPEPLQFALNDGVRIMLVPSDGFGWVLGKNEVAPRGRSECVVGLSAAAPAEVDQIIERASKAGAEIVTEPAEQAWGYSGAFADPDGHIWLVTVAP